MAESGLKIIEIPIAGRKDALEIRIEGRVDAGNSKEFYDSVIEITKTGINNIIFDCREFTYSSSRGMESFLLLFKHLSSQNGTMVLYGVTPKVEKIMKVIEFDRFFKMFEKREEAYSHMNLTLSK